jgi:hypothetical protein
MVSSTQGSTSATPINKSGKPLPSEAELRTVFADALEQLKKISVHNPNVHPQTAIIHATTALDIFKGMSKELKVTIRGLLQGEDINAAVREYYAASENKPPINEQTLDNLCAQLQNIHLVPLSEDVELEKTLLRSALSSDHDLGLNKAVVSALVERHYPAFATGNVKALACAAYNASPNRATDAPTIEQQNYQSPFDQLTTALTAYGNNLEKAKSIVSFLQNVGQPLRGSRMALDGLNTPNDIAKTIAASLTGEQQSAVIENLLSPPRSTLRRSGQTPPLQDLSDLT